MRFLLIRNSSMPPKTCAVLNMNLHGDYLCSIHEFPSVRPDSGGLRAAPASCRARPTVATAVLVTPNTFDAPAPAYDRERLERERGWRRAERTDRRRTQDHFRAVLRLPPFGSSPDAPVQYGYSPEKTLTLCWPYFPRTPFLFGLRLPRFEPRSTMMTSLPMTTVARLDARLHEQMLEVATLRLAVDIQAMRIGHRAAGAVHGLASSSVAPRTLEASAVPSLQRPHRE